MSKPVETPELVNPFTRPPLTEEERAMIPPRHTVPPGRELTNEAIKGAPPIKKADHKEAAKAIDEKIRKQASKVLLAAIRYQDEHKSDMDAEELRIAADALLTDKEAPIGLKISQKLFESFQKQQSEETRPQLAIQINFGGEPIAYPRRVVEEE